MADINNNMGTDKVGHVQNYGFSGTKNQADHEKNYSEKEIKNLDNAHSALVGRSMVKKMQKTDAGLNFDGRVVANIKGDLAELNANPKLIAKADALFNAAIAQGYSYDKAVAMAREFVDSYK